MTQVRQREAESDCWKSCESCRTLAPRGEGEFNVTLRFASFGKALGIRFLKCASLLTASRAAIADGPDLKRCWRRLKTRIRSNRRERWWPAGTSRRTAAKALRPGQGVTRTWDRGRRTGRDLIISKADLFTDSDKAFAADDRDARSKHQLGYWTPVELLETAESGASWERARWCCRSHNSTWAKKRGRDEI